MNIREFSKSNEVKFFDKYQRFKIRKENQNYKKEIKYLDFKMGPTNNDL